MLGKQNVHVIEKNLVVCFHGSGATGRQDLAEALDKILIHHAPFPVTIFVSVWIRKLDKYSLNLPVTHHGGDGQVRISLKQDEVCDVLVSRKIGLCDFAADLQSYEKYVWALFC